MLYYIIQIVLFQALFLLVYDFFLRRETFFNYNRVYLLFTSILSLALPFIKLPQLKKATTNDFVIQLPEVFLGAEVPTSNEVFIAEQAGIILEQPHTPLWQILLFTGIGVATILFVIKISKLYWLRHVSPKRWKGNVLIVKLIRSSLAFSFFNTIFLGEQIPEEEAPVVIKHELVHLREMHTLDLLFFELLRIVFWFNPLVYIYQYRIKELHEFIADANTVKQKNKAAYYQTLLNQIFDVHNISFTNAFFKKSLIKKRIAMLQKQKSRQVALIKYALLIPIVFGILVYTSTEVIAQEESNEKESTITQDVDDEAVIQKYYEDILEENKDLSNFSEISDTYNYSDEKYVPTRDEYLRYVAYMRYMGHKFKEFSEKSEKTSMSQMKSHFDHMINFDKSYDEHLEYLKTKEAKRIHEESLYNRTLRVISKDINNLSAEEHIDAFEKARDVLRGRLYKRLIVSDDSKSIEITKDNYDGLIRLFSISELKSLLTTIDKGDALQLKTEKSTKKEDGTHGAKTLILRDYKSYGIDRHEVVDSVEVPFSIVDEAPTLQKCKDLTNNDERKKCLSNFVNEFVGKNFNTDVADGLSPGRKRIFVQFSIDDKGYIKTIKVRGPSEALEDEAKRVVALLPKFAPGRQKGKNVVVPYSLPIVFDKQSDSKKGDTPKYDKFIDSIEKIEKKKFVKTDYKDATTLPYSIVDVPPTHPNCISVNGQEERKKCTTNEIYKLVSREFKIDSLATLNLPDGKQRIFASFTINKEGFVKQVKVRAAHPKLEEEAKRAIDLLPKFVPGQHKGDIVDVTCSLPIVYMTFPNDKNHKD
ncbi:M56 family metallopeptidase [Winogradskyella sp.]|uniref:M56 family metallopeptidase n=1 Tax=Winogradskyella sp. TaxID=1883156 RepID=UPI0026248027|nr:M56 family metallopeptidase [Winogradskyella sp.]